MYRTFSQNGNPAIGRGSCKSSSPSPTVHAQRAGDLVAHARVAVLEVVLGRVRRAPELVQLARQAAGSAQALPVLAELRADEDVRAWISASIGSPA